MAGVAGAQSSRQPFFFLILDNRTRMLASMAPPWGRPLSGLPAGGDFMMTDWHDLPQVLVWRLAHHPARTMDAQRATACVVASPIGKSQSETRASCGGHHGPTVATSLAALGALHCPGRPLVVIDGADADGANTALCAGLWSPQACSRGVNDPLVRVTGNAPGLQSEVAKSGRRGLCRRMVVPYVAHARSPEAARLTDGRRRPLRIAYAAASWGHVDADAHGFVAWRKALRNACKRAHTANSTACGWVWVSMSGNGAEKALQAYATADFCLQPPGDTLPRPGIIDSISVGCVPVLFHPGQRSLWAAHWPDSALSSVGLDFTGGAPRPRQRDHRIYAPRADAALASLLATPPDSLALLRRGVERAAPPLLYGREAARPPERDAVEVLVGQMRALRLVPAAEEAAAYARQLEARTTMLAAQARHSGRGRVGRRRGAV